MILSSGGVSWLFHLPHSCGNSSLSGSEESFAFPTPCPELRVEKVRLGSPGLFILLVPTQTSFKSIFLLAKVTQPSLPGNGPRIHRGQVLTIWDKSGINLPQVLSLCSGLRAAPQGFVTQISLKEAIQRCQVPG